MTTVVALAGRRIDSPGTEPPRFPLDRVALVAGRLRATFRKLRAGTLVCAAANGADLVALRVAGELGMRCRIVLPFSARKFRRASVTDRPGSELWGWLFEDLVLRARAGGELIVLSRRNGSEAAAFAAANRRILREALLLARGDVSGRRPAARAARAVVVWEGKRHGPSDATAGFAELAQAAGLRVTTVRTRG